MRYFIHCTYKGTHYAGWQRQLNAPTVQQSIEEAFTIVLKTKISIVGCGRTDAGVHASEYYFHFDSEEIEDKLFFRKKVNNILKKDISINRVIPVPDNAHARFDAKKRAYTYFLNFKKDPFQKDFQWYYPYGRLSLNDLNSAAAILLEYKEFFTFCKTHTDVKTMKCELTTSLWKDKGDGLFEYHIASNRFLRGMVRLIVGMCVNVASGKLEEAEVHTALKNQIRLSKSYSVPAKGLFLSKVEYPPCLLGEWESL